MRAAAALVLLLAGCGQAGPGVGNEGASENQIERLSTPKVEPDLRGATVALQPLSETDLIAAGMASPACAFRRDGRLLIAATQQDAIGRIGGAVFHFAQSSPVGPTGGFFEDRQLSVSIGRVQSADGPIATQAGWPARMTVTNRRAEAQVELEGFWRCGA